MEEHIVVWNGSLDKIGACFELSKFQGRSQLYDPDRRAPKAIKPAYEGHEAKLRANRKAYDQRRQVTPEQRKEKVKATTREWKLANRSRVRAAARALYRQKKGGAVRNYTLRTDEVSDLW